MQSGKKTLFNIVFLLAVFGLTVYGVFHGEDLGAMMDAIRSSQIGWLVPGVGLVVFFIWGESIIIWYMMQSFGIRLKKRVCFLFSSVGFFFSCITPSASGGQPMQIYYMKKEKIPIPVSTVVLMVVTITYKLVLVVIGLGIMIFARGFLHHYLEGILPVFYLGLALNVFCVTLMTVLVFHPVLAREMLLKGMGLLERLHLMKKKEARRQKLNDSMEVYRETAVYLKDHKRVLFHVIIITFLQRMALFSVTWFVYRAFQMQGTPAVDVVFLQAVISVSVDMLPLPGGMGISETLFLNIFAPVFRQVLLPAMVLSRGLGYYSQLLISALFTVAAQLHYTNEEDGP
ncbi:MAG TPA: flippase-like domain-containing protein [Candidatus Fusicatenibacter merdavium]|uniref:Phosphatidylglycerol lysyltransferase n=1 Tax=Candidatus Fusicatenibacter merdavium TaxID=2838600 RepID=A0A9D2BJ04_9FIRM|nr:flippase-like domain-containing protein [Candidatus Fusicatenibacter merdavium]